MLQWQASDRVNTSIAVLIVTGMHWWSVSYFLLCSQLYLWVSIFLCVMCDRIPVWAGQCNMWQTTFLSWAVWCAIWYRIPVWAGRCSVRYGAEYLFEQGDAVCDIPVWAGQCCTWNGTEYLSWAMQKVWYGAEYLSELADAACDMGQHTCLSWPIQHVIWDRILVWAGWCSTWYRQNTCLSWAV